MMPVTFHTPQAFFLFLLIPPLIYYYFAFKNKRQASVKYSSVSVVKNVPQSPALVMRHSLFLLRLLAIAMVIIALARPQAGKKGSEVKTEGINICLAVDTSGSMEGMDFQPTRLEAAKKVMEEFISKRKNDRIGLVVFSDEAYLKCPLTLDYGILSMFLGDIASRGQGGTAIGHGIATGVDTLRKAEGKSKVLILLTDGENTAGSIEPATAAEIAKTFGVKIYTIGIGKPGVDRVPIRVEHPTLGTRIQHALLRLNEDVLKRIARITGGEYFNAQNVRALDAVYERIDKLEKTEIAETYYMEYDERYVYYIIAAAIFLLLEVLLANTRFRKLP